MINENVANIDHVHIVFEDRLICTFSEEDWRYHARTILGGTLQLFLRPVLLKHLPKQMQIAAYGTCSDDDENNSNSSNWKEKYLDYGEYRINFAAVGYVMNMLNCYTNLIPLAAEQK